MVTVVNLAFDIGTQKSGWPVKANAANHIKIGTESSVLNNWYMLAE